MSEFTSEQIKTSIVNVKFSIDIKVLEGSNKFVLISTKEMEYKKHFSWQEVKTQVWGQHRPFTYSLGLL